MSKKKFLLVAPKAFNLYELIVKNLEFMGYEVTHIEDSGYPFRYRSFAQRLNNLMRKSLLRDRAYKVRIRNEFIIEQQMNILSKEDKYDLGLVIRADFFDKKLIDCIRNRTNHLISFHFDGLSRNLAVLDYISIFNQFYVFDPADIISFPEYKLLYSPNFYFDYPELLKDRLIKQKSDYVYYVSSHHTSREQDLINIHKYLLQNFKSIDFVVVCQEKNLDLVSDYIKTNMTIMHDHITFEEQLHKIVNSEIIVDLVIADHKGYSFRIFEGLKFGKKVITTNPTIIEADFYHPNNFFVLTDTNWEELEEFLKRDFFKLDENVIGKYSFSNWMNSKVENY